MLNPRIALALAALALAGCQTLKTAPVGRPATDQYLDSKSIEDAVAAMDIGPQIEGKKIKLSLQSIGEDQKYTDFVLRAWAMKCGALIADDKTTDALTLHVLVRSSGSDAREAKWEIPIPLPSLVQGITLTTFVIYKKTLQVARCHLWAYGSDAKGAVAFTQKPVYATHYHSSREFLGVTLGRWTDLPELRNDPPSDQAEAP